MRDEEMTLEEWIEVVPDQERRELIAKTRKRFWIFLLISLIPYVNFITMGITIFCYNNLNFLKTRGRSTGNNGVRFLLMLYGFIIPPLIVFSLCNKIEKLGTKILGW